MRRTSFRTRALLALAACFCGLAAVLSAFLISDTLRAYDYTSGWLAGQFVAVGRSVGPAVGLDLLAYSFGWRSIAIGALVGLVGPLIGIYLVHREMALIGETLAHTAFAGVAIGLLFGSVTGIETPFLVPALVVAIIGAFLVQYLADRSNSYGDVPIAIMLSGSFALGTIVISVGGGLTGINIEAVLFGNVSFVQATGGGLMVGLSAIVLGVVGTQYKQLLFITFDEQAARVAQFDVSLYNSLLVVLTALVVVGAMQILGVILVAAMLVVPVAAASQVARSFREAIYLSVLVGEISALAGIVIAFRAGWPAGGTIVLTSIVFYLAGVVLSNRGPGGISVR
ncbi:metal ABC transporter permease [Haloferacaceae archaeon DSL9]